LLVVALVVPLGKEHQLVEELVVIDAALLGKILVVVLVLRVFCLQRPQRNTQ
jgi:fumarate reductase subunit D